MGDGVDVSPPGMGVVVMASVADRVSVADAFAAGAATDASATDGEVCPAAGLDGSMIVVGRSRSLVDWTVASGSGSAVSRQAKTGKVSRRSLRRMRFIMVAFNGSFNQIDCPDSFYFYPIVDHQATAVPVARATI